ncbi:hypothetical protein [Chitinophaga tropicalis]|uniref:Uncharacterized protein n=1 Tax=Chitinophaga tropicalis TaxID=2683588 RepID=A0A7K1U064_9BACT|nr:hypothetical protein [Chitinophaga tropicalis]MVT07690.1 hypothetical protein [Chitinophaga tropicalis]
MNNKQYEQYCRLQEAIRGYGFPQVYDQMLSMAVKDDPPGFRINLLDFSSGERIRYKLQFYKFDSQDDYTFDHYQLFRRGEIPIKATVINGIDTALVDARMGEINWHGINEDLLRRDEERGSGRLHREINRLLSDLDRLTVTEEGTHLMELLATKHLAFTPLAAGSHIHPRLEELDQTYSDTVKISTRRPDAPIARDAIFILSTPPQERTDYMAGHEAYEVRTKGYEHRSTKEQHLSVGVYNDKSRYFTTLKKAVDHIERIPLDQFDPIIVIADRLPLMIKEAIIYDCTDDQVIAVKTSNWDLNKKETLVNNIISWHLTEGKTTAADFKQKSGLALSSYGQPDEKGLTYQVYPPIGPADGHRHRKPFKRKDPPDNRGLHM